ncbi:hypothetical protein CsSME_00003457 [Camellia sinensis var. sinensis]
MALAKDPKPSQMGLVQSSTYYNNVFGIPSSSIQPSNQSSPELYVFDDHHKAPPPPMSRSSSLSSSNGYATAYQPAETHSVIDFKTSGINSFMHNNNSGSFLSFEQNDQQDDYSIWEDNLIHGYRHDHQRLSQDFNCVQSASTYGGMGSALKENPHGGEAFGWPESEANANATINGTIQEVGAQEACFNKRPHAGESMQALKRQCSGSATRKAKPKSTPSKDPQSIAAKNRRERISERLKVLQELVPNGSKVDLVTMLEKAISYVKFLQLQVKVLATDEFWPVQGGKAPDISQVKEAIDAILSTQKDRNSRSK